MMNNIAEQRQQYAFLNMIVRKLGTCLSVPEESIIEEG
jgi:hypothetical protein